MIAKEAKLGRVFVLRLENGDRIPECIEDFASHRGIESAVCALVGGIGGGKVVVGPERPFESPISPMLKAIEQVHEAAAVGTIFPNEEGKPTLHMHAALGREGDTVTGCVRPGIEVWQICEVVIIEILGTGMARRMDPNTGFAVLSAE